MRAGLYLTASAIICILLFGVGSMNVAAADLPEGCYATLENDVLVIGNTRIRREFRWNKGHLISTSITDVATNRVLELEKQRPDFALGKLTDDVQSGSWTARTVESSIAPRQLQIEVTTSYETVDVRRVFRVYPDCPAIGCEYYVRTKSTPVPAFAPKDTMLQSLRLPGAHWRYSAIEFFDQTDGINNLVRETSGLAYTRPFELRGNLLIAENPVRDQAVFMVKEAPCSFVQLHYPGHDFLCSITEARVVGAGIEPEDLTVDQWIRIYGVATGICAARESSVLLSLRAYQKQLRRQLPERDEMIMMNTWGDRNRDARIGEQFVNDQVDACVRLGVTHLQIDDGWQQGLSRNSADNSGRLWDQWDEASWLPNAERFPNGFLPVVQHAKKQGVDLGLWFHPSNANDYEHWERDARIVINLYRRFGIRYFKIDGVKLPTKPAELNLRRFFDQILDETDGAVVFNLDATADNRAGYHYFYEYGNIFLENRYTDFARYYPHWTLRNLWMLSRYVPAEKLQIEFLNKWRNAAKYPANDPLAPSNVPWDYQFAITMMAQPLAWFEGSELPAAGFEIAPVIQAYRRHQADIHRGAILPIGDEPSGTSWTGFQSVLNPREGYLLVLREHNASDQAQLQLFELAGRTIRCEHLCGHGQDFTTTADEDGRITCSLPAPHSFALYRYTGVD